MKIQLNNIHKKFASNVVLSGVNFELLDGEIHALMGENGAGKSTLMNILTGMFAADDGTIIIDGKAMQFANSQQAEAYGITFIRQELNVWQNLTVLENLFLAKEIRNRIGLLDNQQMKKLANAKLVEIGIQLELDKLVSNCSIGEQQMIEIVKALMTNAKVLIMDEPTSALTEREANVLFQVMQRLKQSGVGMVYISHRMEEIFTHCDRITVMRDGVSVSTSPIADTSFNQVVKEMVGRELSERFPARDAHIGDEILKVEGLTGAKFKDISFTLKRGEILGFAGLMGAGRSEIMRVIFGLDPLISGTIKINGKELKINSPNDAIKNGIGFITENRRDEGVILGFSIRDNIAINNMHNYVRSGLIDSKAEDKFILELTDKLLIKMASVNLNVGSLSGGNQQKVVIAKWLGNKPQILIMDEPTRGIDVNAKREIYQLMNELSKTGVAIIMVSSELPEIIGMSDRVAVIHEGTVAGILERENLTQEKIISLAAGEANAFT
jgi:ribose transport system ATP-binding protein